MLPGLEKIIEFEQRNEAFAKITKEFDKEFERVKDETVGLSNKINTMFQEMKDYEHTYTKEKVRRLMKLMKIATAYVDLETEVYNENTALQKYITDYFNRINMHFEANYNNRNEESLKKMMDAVEELEKKYIPVAKRMMKQNSRKLPLILQKHEEVRKLYSAFEI